MSIAYQKQILKEKRLAKGLSKKSLGPRYAALEAGKYPFGRTQATTYYPIIQMLDLTMNDLKHIYE